MSRTWIAAAFDGAERVPVWTRPEAGGFAAFAIERSAFAASEMADADADSDRHGDISDGVREEPPELDPLPAIEAQAFAQGFDAGHAAAAAALADERLGLARLAEGLAALRPAPPADLAALLAETVSRLVHQIVGEVAFDGATLARRVDSIAALIEDEAGVTRLRLHPADLARLESIAVPMSLVADPSLAEGTIVAETPSGWIEDGPAIRMDRLRGALDAMAR